MTELLLNIILIGIIALLLALFQYVFKSKKNKVNSILAFIRFFTYFFILVLILNPSIKKNSIEITKPILAVAIDNSKSIKYNAQDINVKNFITSLKENTVLNKKFTINYYSFGNKLKVLDSLNFNENQTNLAVPFQEFLKLYSKVLAPVIIISDGNQTVGNSLEFIQYKSPVFPYIVGDTTIYEDIYIKQLNVNKFTNINNKFPVELFVNYTGTKPVSKKLSIYHKGTKVYSKQLHFSKSKTIKNESFFLTATSKGAQYYTATIEALKNEQNTVNNTKNFSINVLAEKSKILILTSIIHPDLGMLKKSIESNKQYAVTIKNISDFKGNTTDYQLVILNQPTKEFKNVFEKITAKKLHYFIISGLSTDWEFLNKIQPNFKKNILSQTENYYPVFNATYASYISKDIGFSNFAPLKDSFGDVLFSIPYNTLLFQQIEAIKTEKPLLATFEINNQRAAILLGENSWQWRMNSYVENDTFEYFDNFISNLIQYLSSNKRNKQLSVSIAPIYYSNESIQISASFLDKNFNFDSRAKLWLTVSNKKKNFLKKLPFSLSQTNFFVELPNMPAGEYTYVASVENQNAILSGSFKILPYEVEQQFVNSNKTVLKIVANKTKGTIYYVNEERKLIDNLSMDTRFKSIQKITTKQTPLINWQWILGLIIFFLSIEWFTRKYFGKV